MIVHWFEIAPEVRFYLDNEARARHNGIFGRGKAEAEGSQLLYKGTDLVKL